MKNLLSIIGIFLFLISPLKGDEKIKKNLDPHKYNFYTGMFAKLSKSRGMIYFAHIFHFGYCTI